MYFLDKELSEFLDNSELVILDMNGLIVDDEGIQLEAVNKTLQEHGIFIEESVWLKQVGRRSNEIFNEIIIEHGIKGVTGDQLSAIKNEHYDKFMKKNVENVARAGIRDLVNHLKGKKRLAVVTSASPKEVRIILGGLGIIDDFEFVVNGSQVKNAKPSPEIYLKVLELSGVGAKNCVAFEDTGLGIESAHAAKIPCIGVPTHFTREHDLSKADFVIDSLTKNAKILEKHGRDPDF